MNDIIGFLFLWILTGLAIYRVAHMLALESGPWKIFKRLRDWPANNVLGDLLACPFCLSVWLGLVAALFLPDAPFYQTHWLIINWLLHGLGLSAFAVILLKKYG